MKKIQLLILFTGILLQASAQSTSGSSGNDLKIAAMHDFGKIRHGRPVTYSFEFQNPGMDSLRITNVSASCGCTTPEWSKEATAPGGTGMITVGYNAASEGRFEKSVTIFYNAGKTKTIYIKGEVDKAVPSAPLNSSIVLLKQVNK